MRKKNRRYWTIQFFCLEAFSFFGCVGIGGSFCEFDYWWDALSSQLVGSIRMQNRQLKNIICIFPHWQGGRGVSSRPWCGIFTLFFLLLEPSFFIHIYMHVHICYSWPCLTSINPVFHFYSFLKIQSNIQLLVFLESYINILIFRYVTFFLL